MTVPTNPRLLGGMWLERGDTKKSTYVGVRHAPPRKKSAPDLLNRDHLSPDDVLAMITRARDSGVHGLRNALLILLTYTHALRVSEVLELRWSDVDLDNLSIKVSRMNNGVPSVHALNAQEAGWLLRLRRAESSSAYIFCSSKGSPLTRRTVHFIVSRVAESAGIVGPVHPHMLRHARAFHLASTGIEVSKLRKILGHRNVQHTQKYTQQS